MQATIVSLLSITAVAYVGLGLLLYTTQRSILYYPTPDMGAVGADTVRIDSEGESLKVLRLNDGLDRAVLYFGGNAESVSMNAPEFTRIFDDATVYLVNYRGYGGSSGSPTEQALYADAAAVFDHLAARHRSIAVIGRSLGAAVATYLASVRGIDRLVLVTPPDSIEKVAAHHYPFYPISLFLKDKFRTIDHVDAIAAPTLIIMAENDRIIPRERTEALIAAFGDHELTAVTLPETDHNTIDWSPTYTKLLEDFL
ncbi:MAG: lysophospholipase [Gammaproteobacteria bacterium]|nr:lysophospholipase [Gammaproteobacteria bacterium]MBT8444650.1 lysophospholipase [Gammaproteobacteria bacterium]NND36471.1 alpha/beta fold hydrolase [Gammaproteobacteria bacterium]